MCDGIAVAHRVNLLSALTSKIGHVTNTDEIRRFTTLLNSGDTAPLPPGIWLAEVKERGCSLIRSE
jgi:hypothetical protein